MANHGNTLLSICRCQRTTFSSKAKKGDMCDAGKNFVNHDTASAFITCINLSGSKASPTLTILVCFKSRIDFYNPWMLSHKIMHSKRNNIPSDPVPRSKQCDPVSVWSALHSLRFAPNDSTWQRCLLGYP